MKYSIDEYMKELDKAREVTSSGEKLDEMMAPCREKLYQGLEIGDGVTVHLWSDAHACTIIRRTKATIWVQRDHAVRTDKNGMSEDQDYSYEPNIRGTIFECRWSPKRKCFMYQGKAVGVGRREYYDYTF